MDHYVDIRLLPDPEFSVQLLMDAVFGRLHRALVAQAGRDGVGAGVSFPEVRGRSLGTVVRLHGPRNGLEVLLAEGWLNGLRDHVEVASVRPVPTQVSHRTVRRVQSKSSAERLRRRLMRRQGIEASEARRRIPDGAERHLDLPSLQLRSASTGQHFRLFIDHGPLLSTADDGQFSTYGLSDRATVPWF